MVLALEEKCHGLLVEWLSEGTELATHLIYMTTRRSYFPLVVL